MSPSSTLANRSFLYNGSISSSSSNNNQNDSVDNTAISSSSGSNGLDNNNESTNTWSKGGQVEYVTLELNNSIANGGEKATAAGDDEETKPNTTTDYQSSLKKRPTSEIATSTDISIPIYGNHHHHQQQQNSSGSIDSDQSDAKTTSSGSNNSSLSSLKIGSKKKHNRNGSSGSSNFAKNILHYVPLTNRRYSRNSTTSSSNKDSKSRGNKLASKSISLKSLGIDTSSSSSSSNNKLAPKCRTLSRDELKYVSISLPSNFVHWASGSNASVLNNGVDIMTMSSKVFEHKAVYADLRGTEYAEIATALSFVVVGLNGEVVEEGNSKVEMTTTSVGGKVEDEEEKEELDKNQSFLWSAKAQVKAVQEEVEDEDYDDVGPPVGVEQEGPTELASRPIPQHDDQPDYDDVGNLETTVIEPTPATTDNDNYDDVGPPLTCSSPVTFDDEVEAYDDELYDDVGPLLQQRPAVVVSLSNGDKSEARQDDTANNDGKDNDTDKEVEEEEMDDDVYDDVGLPMPVPEKSILRDRQKKEVHERVNSLYAGSLVINSIPGWYDKESEWEDVDDTATVYEAGSSSKIISETSHTLSTSPGKKKANALGPRWACKLRRQRSKASRKSSSARSTSRTRSRGQKQESTGLPTVMMSNRYDSSDDSNYETLQSYEPDDFSSDSEPETTPTPTPQINPSLHLSLGGIPPSRPIPPPPREASLGHSLGRRMKMLRRTWSITKGSLGRMRRRASNVECSTSTDNDTSSTNNNNNHSSDARKYFSFKKHFRNKSQPNVGGLSTFYLDPKSSGSEKETNGGGGSTKVADNEPIYSNGDWYRDVGLYGYAKGSEVKKDEEMREDGTGMQEMDDGRMIDHYSVLAEEPLYQFYAADATRVAFESDSDGYEEVEELTPSTATTDLAKPGGHRTLWYQTPQVISSGLLQGLTMEERKIQEAKFEILTSEASYLNSLRVLENEFASNYELTHEVLTPAERDKLFGSVPDVLVASERFLAELEQIWREDPMLGNLPELLLKHGDKSANVYVDYCSNQVSIDVMLKELKAKKGYKFLETVSKIEMHPACHSLSLHSFLMLPMQRITRLPLLADAVLSKLSCEHVERTSWERVLAALSQIVAKCNEGARLAERRNEMEALARKLEYPIKIPPINLRDRELIRSGTVVQLSTKSDSEYKLTFGKKFHKTPLMLLLLTDYLLVTKLKSNSNEETYSVMETCKRSLVALESAPEDSPFAGRHAMVLTLLENHSGRQVEYILTCENDTEKERWLDAVSPPKPSCVGETLYESWDCPQVMAVYSYAPRQPDELALQPGDVINVLRKMNDGWLFGEKLLDGEQGWFPGNFTKEVASEHVRARNLRQRHRFLALSGSVLQKKVKQSLSLL